MSRIGKSPIEIPAGVKVTFEGLKVVVEGKLGRLEYETIPPIKAEIVDNEIIVTRANDSREQKALHGLTRALINNMVVGVTQGYEKILWIIGTGYNGDVTGPWLKLALGYSHDILIEIPEGIKVTVDQIGRGGAVKDLNSVIKIKGINKEDVGKFAAEIRNCRPPEVYKGKGVRYHDEHISIKAVKAGA
ncbi:MAG: 50S ribosomal protein L6 [Candidatus Cloacimonetes bacterium]|nr:50S ribosomal protein L6 [Candidatus Cloacimonadota bacterium]